MVTKYMLPCFRSRYVWYVKQNGRFQVQQWAGVAFRFSTQATNTSTTTNYANVAYDSSNLSSRVSLNLWIVLVPRSSSPNSWSRDLDTSTQL